MPGSKPKASDANFDDLLSGQGFSGTKEKKGPRTIAEMRKEEMAKEMDPEKLKAGTDFPVTPQSFSHVFIYSVTKTRKFSDFQKKDSVVINMKHQMPSFHCKRNDATIVSLP